ncbi:MAG: DUF4252 domain-containing protein [Clostridium sp.]|nr:DUF4252 domain-containing protein [Bacteroides sp.]MCM1199225.1 DUF4252 domain-containing protein [Clostridium sp.]MCM1515744.1 DUF4252 domain-containing protein [Paraprevotella sp.]
MKRLITAFLLISLSIMGFSQTSQGGVPKDKLLALVSEYSNKSGFDVVKIGAFGTSILKTAMRASAAMEKDDDMKQAVKLMKGIDKMAIIDYEDCSKSTREAFSTRLEKILDSSEMLMEMTDGSDTMRLYGAVDKEGSTIKDFVMYVPEDCALICLFGNIPTGNIAQIIELK